VTDLGTAPPHAGHHAHGEGFVVYEWQAFEHYLAMKLLPAATFLHAAIDDSALAVLARMPRECRAFLFQVNLSCTARFPPERGALVEALAARGIRILNGSLTDVRKTALRRLLRAAGLPSLAAARNGDQDETLMVKTDFNYGGFGERLLSPAERRVLGLSADEIGLRDWSDYRVLPRRDMPDEWWLDASLVVERFVENPQGEFFRVYVAGDSVMVVKAYTACAIKKVTGGQRDENVLFSRRRLPNLGANDVLSDELLSTLHRFLARVDLDFGSLDVVHDGERCFIVDLNLTPHGARGVLRPEVEAHLRQGMAASAPGSGWSAVA